MAVLGPTPLFTFNLLDFIIFILIIMIVYNLCVLFYLIQILAS
jgi:hypothetical protein